MHPRGCAQAALSDAVRAGDVELRLATPGDNSILAEPCDILAPCGFGSVLNAETIPTLQCKIVCGAANNQLQDPFRGDEAIAAKGITYIPDFLANRMGTPTQRLLLNP